MQIIVVQLIWLIALISSPIVAQQGNLKFRHLTPNDGVSQSTINSILQDHKGFMWFATSDGLNRYNGYEISIYKPDPNNVNSINYNDITTLYEDKKKNLWIGTLGRGVNKFDRKTETFSHYSATTQDSTKLIINDVVLSILEDSNNNLWFATGSGVSIRYNGQNYFSTLQFDVNNEFTLSNNDVRFIYEDSKNNVWVGTFNGLNKYNPITKTFTRYLHNPQNSKSISNGTINEIVEDKAGNLWIATDGGGLNKFDYETEIFTKYQNNPLDPTSIADNTVYSILEDSQGNFWVGTENQGLDLFDRENEIFYHHKNVSTDPNSINNNTIYSLYESSDKTLWIGTYAGGVNIIEFNESKFEHFKNDPYNNKSLSNNSVLSFLEDSEGNIWVGTDGGGLNQFELKSGEFNKFEYILNQNENTLPSEVILNLKNGKNADIWLGMYRGGISRYNTNSHQIDNFINKMNGGNGARKTDVFAIHVDKNGRVWAGTNGGGLYLKEPNKDSFTYIKNQNIEGNPDFNIDYIRDFLEDSKGNLWIGTDGNGVAKIDRETLVTRFFNMVNSNLTSLKIFTVFEDSKQRIWFGSRPGGLFLLNADGESITNYSFETGFTSDVINGILEDDFGNLWLSTNDGITKFNPDDVTVHNFGIEDGVQSKEFNPDAAFKDNNGYMYFGGINGFNRFHPDSINQSKEIYPIEFTDFQIFNKDVEIGENSPLKTHISEVEEIVLSYDLSMFSIEYTSLNYKKEKGDTYAYLLEGFDDDWNYVNDRRLATYTNLDPGNYTFRVKVGNSDDFWSPEEATLKIIITPPFWKTNIFYFLVSIAFFGIIFTWYRIRVKSITDQNRKLEEEVSERTSELRDKNKALEETFEDLRKTRGELVENAHKAGMADIAVGVLHNVGNILNSVNTSSSLIKDTLVNSKLKMLTQANKMLNSNMDTIEDFIANDTKGKQLLNYYLKLEEPLLIENKELIVQSDRLAEKIMLINEVISAQQSYVNFSSNNDSMLFQTIIEDTLTLFTDSMNKHDIKIIKELNEVDPVVGQKTKLIHILVNLIKNAKESMSSISPELRSITFNLTQDDDFVTLKFSDTGSGIESKNLKKIFTQGFTTKKSGHGLGLHSCANYIKEMGGKIEVQSKGINEGATFILTLKKA